MYIIIILILILILWVSSKELFSNKNATFVELTGRDTQLIYNRSGSYLGTMNAEIIKYKINSGPNNVILYRLDTHPGITSRYKDDPYLNLNSPIIVNVPPNKKVIGFVNHPTYKIMLKVY